MIRIGDTPESLGSITTANALVIDGKVFTKEQVIALKAERDSLAAQVANLNNYIAAITHADETGYVDGVGFVEDFSEIKDRVTAIVSTHDAEVAKDAYISALNSYAGSVHPDFYESMAEQYAAQLRTKK